MNTTGRKIPFIANGLSPAELVDAINDRIRRIEHLTVAAAAGTSAATTSPATTPTKQPGGGSSGTTGATTPAAPNVTGLTATATLGSTTYVISGQFAPPSNDPQYAHLVEVRLQLSDQATGAPVSADLTLSQPFTLLTTPYQFPVLPRDLNQSHTYVVTAWAINDDGKVTANAPTATVTVTVAKVTAVTGREVPNSITVDPTTRLISTTIGATPTFSSAGPQVTLYNPTTGLLYDPTSGSMAPQVAAYLLSQDNGATFVWIGWNTFTYVGQEIQFQRVKPIVAQWWVIAMVAGAVGGDPTVYVPAANLPAGAVVSPAFLVQPLTLPQPTDITTLTVPAGTSGLIANPYNTQNSDGAQYYAIPTITYNDTGATGDPNAFFVRITATDLDSSHNPIGPEQAFAGTQVSQAGQTQTFGPLIGAYGNVGYGYTRTGNLGYVRLKVYVSNRVDQTTTAWSNALASTLQSQLNGIGYMDVMVAAGGNPPRGALVGSNIAQSSLGQGLAVVPPVGNPTGTPVLSIGTGNISTSVLYDPSFWCVGSYTGNPFGEPSAGWVIFWQYYGSVTVRNDGGFDDAYYMRLTNASAQVFQGITCTPGESLNCSCMMRSNNVGAPHGFYLQVLFYNSSGSYVSTGVVASTSGYIASWTKLAGYVPVPATACYAIIQCIVINTETSGGYWDVDTVLVQHVVNQSGSGQTATMQPALFSGDQSAVQVSSTSTTAASFYGLQIMRLIASDGSQVQLQVQTGAAILSLLYPAGAGSEGVGLSASPGGSAVTVTRNNVGYQGVDATISGHNFKGGICIS